MKVLKTGVIPGSLPIQVTCSHCKTEFEFMESEARVEHDRNETCLVVACPLCKKEIWKAKK